MGGMANSRHVVFWADPKEYAALLRIAEKEDRSVSSLLRLAIREYLKGRK